jgi:hypothetical protein
MSYLSGQQIAAADYNGMAQTTTGGNVAFVMGTGSAQYGYGQTTTGIAAVSATGTVTATQWAGLVYLINRGLGHQSGSAAQLATGSNIGITAGARIAAFANVLSAATTINTNAATFNAQGTTVTGSNYVAWANAGIATSYTNSGFATRTVTFASADGARYFFNAGGQLNFVISSVTNIDATARTSNIVTLFATNLGGFSAFRNTSGGGRTGSGGTLNTNSTTIGYRNLTTAYQTLVQVTSTTAPYTTDVANLLVKSNGVQGTHQDLGTIVHFALGLSAPESGGWNDTLTAGVNHRIDVVPPETTYLNNSWGTITVA